MCGGGFVAMSRVLPVLLADGVTPAKLKEIIARDGRKLRPCPTCSGRLTSFPIRRELVHACTPCSAAWLDAGGLERLDGVALRNMAGDAADEPPPIIGTPLSASPFAPASQLDLARDVQARGSPMQNVVARPLPGAQAGLPSTRTPMPSAPWPSAPTPSSPAVDPDHGSWNVPPPAPPVDDTPFKPSVGAFTEGGGSFVGRAMKIGVGVAVLGILYFIVTTAMEKGVPTPIGGGYQVLFWNQPVKKTSVTIGSWQATRYLSPWGTNVLEAAYVPGAGGDPAGELGKNGKPEQIAAALYGRWIKMISGPSVLDNGLIAFDFEYVIENTGTTKNIGGWARVEFNERDAFVVCGNSDSNLFPKSNKVNSFLATLTKMPASASAKDDHSKALTGLAPDVD